MEIIASTSRRPLSRAAFAGAVLAAALSTQAQPTSRFGAAPAPPDPLPAYADPRVGSFVGRPKDHGIRSTRIDLDRLDACLAAIRLQAGNPEPRYNTPAEADRARRDAVQLGLMLADISRNDDTGLRLLLRAAVALSLADNLGAPGAGELAEARFSRLLAKTPDNAEAGYEYGVFLVNRGRPGEAVSPLTGAVAAGEERARWPLAVALAALDRDADATEQLDALRTRQPRLAGAYPVAALQATLRPANRTGSP